VKSFIDEFHFHDELKKVLTQQQNGSISNKAPPPSAMAFGHIVSLVVTWCASDQLTFPRLNNPI